MGETGYYTYIVECADGTFYTGWTNDLERRISAHNAGAGARYTRSRLPVKLIASWSFESRSAAMKFEVAIKGMSRDEKAKLITQTTCGE